MSVRYPKTKSPFGREEEEKSQRLQAKKPVAESLFGGEETDGAFDVQMDEGPKDIEERPGDAEVIPPRMETALQAGGGDLASVTRQRQPQLEGAKEAPAPAEEEPQGLFEDVTDIDARQERERQAFADELAARKAEQQQQAEARAGLGGMGLSGATAELTADIGRQAERAGDIAMADLGRRQQQETFDELRRQASIWTFEEEFGVDLDGDGKFGSGEQKDEDAAGQEEIADIAGRQEKQKQSNQEKYDAYHNSVPTDPVAVAASNALGGIEAWKLANGAKEIDRYRDENGVEYIVYELGDGTVVKGTSQGLVGTAADALFKEGAEA